MGREGFDVVNEAADFAHRFVREDTCLLHIGDGVHKGECILLHLLEGCLAELFHDSPKLSV